MAALIGMGLAMFVSSMIAGLAPTAFGLHPETLSLATSFGSGLLVATALSVIIPEGAASVYSASSLADSARSNGPGLVPNIRRAVIPSHDDVHNNLEQDNPINPRAYIGPALVFGFAFMFLIDQISSHAHSHGTTRIAVADLRDSQAVAKEKAKRKLAATIGLVVHAAADGIALGAASASSDDTQSLELIVFVAIMLHKAPSAFALCTYLLHDGCTKRTIKQHLLLFSAAAPVTSILTYFLLLQFSGDSTASDLVATKLWTGVLLLFSAGTFLYVATIHVMPEVYRQQKPDGGGGGHDAHGGSGVHEMSLSKPQIVCILAGFIVPLLLSFGDIACGYQHAFFANGGKSTYNVRNVRANGLVE